MEIIKFSDESLNIVSLYEALSDVQKSATYWSRDDVSPVRIEIKKHYIQAQQFKCAYCGQQNFTLNAAVWDAEHIIPKNINPSYMFLPHNLAVACKDCNIAKGDAEVRINPRRVTFPTRSQDYRIVHPHFDNLHEHIDWIFPVCVPLSEKGAQTIHICKLYRFSVQQLGGGVGRLADPTLRSVLSKLNTATTQDEAKLMVGAIDKYLDASDSHA
jgi:5-methylcytosine-specific restriction endonuclease McrA